MALYYRPIADGLNLNYLRNVIYKYIYIYLQAFYGVLLPMDKDMYPNQVIVFFSISCTWRRCITLIRLHHTYLMQGII